HLGLAPVHEGMNNTPRFAAAIESLIRFCPGLLRRALIFRKRTWPPSKELSEEFDDALCSTNWLRSRPYHRDRRWYESGVNRHLLPAHRTPSSLRVRRSQLSKNCYL